MASLDFDFDLTIQLAQLSEETYTQYQKGLDDPNYDGQVTVPSGFVQTASFTAPEIQFSKLPRLAGQVAAQPDLLTQDETLQSVVQSAGAGVRDVFFGFSLASDSQSPSPAGYNVIALRGTQSIQEWLEEILGGAVQVPVPLVWLGSDDRFELAKVEAGFALIFAFLFDQVLKAAKGFDTDLPTYVTGHSLGGALAVLAAATVDLLVYGGKGIEGQVQMYSFAGPQPGDPVFAKAYDLLLPASFRVANLSDVVPIVPPSGILGLSYTQVGTEWSYLDQTGDVGGNHSLADNYLPAVEKKVETDAPRTFPNNGIGT